MKLRVYIVIVAMLSLIAGCSSRTTLSDRELAQIFHDAFLANAYTSKEGIRLDSLRLYEPIFQKYGYTTEDVQHSIGSFSTRKSARLSDVVEQAIDMLEQEGKRLDREVAILDTINNIAQRRTTRVIYSDSLRIFTSLADSTTMSLTIEDPIEGNYRVSFKYFIDSLDTSRTSYRSEGWLERTKIDTVKGDTTIITYRKSNTQLRRNDIATYSNNIEVDESAERIVLNLITTEPVTLNRWEKEGVKKETKEETPTYHARLKDLSIVRVPSKEEAMERLYEEKVGIKIFDDELLYSTPKDSL